MTAGDRLLLISKLSSGNTALSHYLSINTSSPLSGGYMPINEFVCDLLNFELCANIENDILLCDIIEANNNADLQDYYNANIEYIDLEGELCQ